MRADFMTRLGAIIGGSAGILLGWALDSPVIAGGAALVGTLLGAALAKGRRR